MLAHPAPWPTEGTDPTMTQTIVPPATHTGQPRLLVSVDPDKSLPFTERKGNRLLTNGYRFAHRDAESYTCTGPDGQAYIVNLAAGYCTCPATARGSHMVAAERVARICATHDCQPRPEWFDGECAQCGAPSWSFVRSGSYGRSWRVAVCPCGCEWRTMPQPEVAR